MNSLFDNFYNYKPADNTTVGTTTDYQNSGSAYVSALHQNKIELEKQRLQGLDMYTQMAQQSMTSANLPLVTARENDLYATKNQAAATNALQSYTDPYMQTIQEKYAQYMQENNENIANQYEKVATSFSDEIQGYIDTLDEADQEYASMQSKLISYIFADEFRLEPDDPRWYDEMKKQGYIDDAGNTTAMFDELIARKLYGEDWDTFYTKLRGSGTEGKDIADWLLNLEGTSMRNEVAGALGIAYDPNANYGTESFKEMVDSDTGLYRSGAIYNYAGIHADYSNYSDKHKGMMTATISNMPEMYEEISHKNNLYDSKNFIYYGLKENSTKNVDEDGRQQEATYGSIITYNDGTTVELEDDIINAGGNIEGKINKNRWNFIDRTPGTTYGDKLSLEDALEDDKLKVGSIFEGEDGQYYMIVYFDKDKTGHSDIAVRKVKNINGK